MSPLQLFDIVKIREEPERGEWLVEAFEFNNDAVLKVRLIQGSFRTYKPMKELMKIGDGIELALTSDRSYIRVACKDWLASGEKVMKEESRSEKYVSNSDDF
jgi:hypothetical protein